MPRIGRGPTTEWDTVLSPSAAMDRAAQLMREQEPQDGRLIAFTLRIARDTDLAFMSDMAAMAKHFGFVATPWSRCCEEYGVVQFTRRSP